MKPTYKMETCVQTYVAGSDGDRDSGTLDEGVERNIRGETTTRVERERETSGKEEQHHSCELQQTSGLRTEADVDIE
ncbi:hypothetical protein R1flu_017507 [Riccia fluitans]|uniref:Uncharacterized protein n=1 Tax=Riccia fluitans TaxID=41844 RepID=A0ABD1ZD67_9MARC